MKLFLTIFGAILAAAAVIWAVFAYNASTAKHAAADLQFLESLTRSAKSVERMAIEFEKVDDKLLLGELSSAKYFEEILRAGRIDRSKAQSLAFNYVYSYREIIGMIRKDLPQHNKWADDMEATNDNGVWPCFVSFSQAKDVMSRLLTKQENSQRVRPQMFNFPRLL